MNILEKELMEGAEIAHSQYENMAGYWLSHGPESILMCSTALYLSSKMKYSVFVDASPKKIKKERSSRPIKGRKPRSDKERFDIVVWNISNADVKAIIEIKRAYSASDLKSDREKISKHLDKNSYIKSGYLLVYTESKKIKTIPARFKRWATEFNCKLVNKIEPKGDEDGYWSIGLLKCL